jgi:hypothetical protein
LQTILSIFATIHTKFRNCTILIYYILSAISTRNSKQCKITENNTDENFDFNIEERKIALKEHELQIHVQEAATRKALAEAEAMELINLEKKKSLGLL